MVTKYVKILVISALTNFPDGDKSNQFGLMTEEIAA